jgi:hypothetical protein
MALPVMLLHTIRDLRLIRMEVNEPRTSHPTAWFPGGSPCLACRDIRLDLVVIIACTIKPNYQYLAQAPHDVLISHTCTPMRALAMLSFEGAVVSLSKPDLARMRL